jgi:5-methylcytosine-specific restriction endonuclease McrA
MGVQAGEATKTPGGPQPARAQVLSRPARYIGAAVRDRAFERDSGRCSFVGSNGRRGGSTRALQLDHVHPVARGGSGSAENLRLLCAYHNRLEAERLMGAAGGTRRRSQSAPQLR